MSEISVITDEELLAEIGEAKDYKCVPIEANHGELKGFTIQAPNGYPYSQIPRPSEAEAWKILERHHNWPRSIADAWELVEEMRKAECNIEILIGSPIYVSVLGDYSKLTDNTKVAHYINTNKADTAPRAICLAWLEWRKGRGEG